jgi:hypothetical protein
MTKRRRASGGRKVSEGRFWGAAPEPSKPRPIRPTPDPGALVRSLGQPPLSVDPGLADRHLTAVYEEAVKAATALLAANGLLDAGDEEG